MNSFALLIGSVVVGVVVGCASPRAVPSASPGAAVAPPPAAAPGLGSRVLPSHPTFADVVDLARELDASSSGQSQDGCLFAGAPVRFSADVLLATRPLSDAPKELASSLVKAAGPPTVLTAWGSAPGELPEVTLAAFTTTTPASSKATPVGVFVTGQGVFLRGAALALRARPEALDLGSAGALLAQLPDPVVAYVSAEAGISVAQLTAALRSLPNRFEVALAVVLPKGTRLPATAERSRELLCPDGLPEPQADEAEGSLEPSALRAVLAPLKDAALRCALATGGLALQGGRLELAMRIGANGRARELCMLSDTIDEAILRKCIVEAARGIAFPVPAPAGFVDLVLPLQLALSGPPAQRALCE